jgi:hypothetical protein
MSLRQIGEAIGNLSYPAVSARYGELARARIIRSKSVSSECSLLDSLDATLFAFTPEYPNADLRVCLEICRLHFFYKREFYKPEMRCVC